MPNLETYTSALLTANRLSDEHGTAVGAIYDDRGILVQDSLRSIDKTDSHQPADPEWIHRPSPVIGQHNFDGHEIYLDEAVFGGHVFAGWGHNITETLGTAWAAKDVAIDVPLLLVPWGRQWVSTLPRIREVLGLAGWDNRRLVIASGAVVLGKVHVPERLINLRDLMQSQGEIDPAMNSVYDLMIHRATGVERSTSEGPVFLARPRGHRREHPTEVALENMLTARGVRIVQGWNMTIPEQIESVNRASALVGFSGSSLHNSVFGEPGIPVIEILDLRGSSRANSGQRELQAPLCALRNQSHRTVDGYSGEQARSLNDILAEIESLL